MRNKKIPVTCNGRVIMESSEEAPAITRVYDRLWRFFPIRKIYHVRGKKFVIETKRENGPVNICS